MLGKSRSALLFASLLASVVPASAGDPAVFLNPFRRSPLTAEFEVYSGGISGQDAGAAYQSLTRGSYGSRFTFGFMRSLNFNLNYLYSNQVQQLVAITPPSGSGQPTGTALMRAANLNVLYGNGEFNLIRHKRSAFYLSPGVGFSRNGSRSLSVITPAGSFSGPIAAGTSVTFNLGMGARIFPWRHLGFRIDARDFVAGHSSGSLNTTQVVQSSTTCDPSICGNYFGPVPVQNNVILSLGLIFKLL